MEKKVFKISKRKLKKGLIVFLISFIALFIINHFGEFQYENRLSDEASQRSREHFYRQQMASINEIENEYKPLTDSEVRKLMKEPGGFHRMMTQSVKDAFQRSEADAVPGTGIASPFYHSSFDYVVTKITLNTIGGVSTSTTYDKPFLLGGFGSAYKTDNNTGHREEMSYLDKIPFYILSTIYNLHCILIMMFLFFGINYLYKKVEFQIN
jgi:hypothetical protein